MPPSPPPRRRFGQNFLVDRRAIERIVDALEPLADGPVVEIGPGRGALTGPLLARSPSGVTAVEIDRDLAAALEDRFGPSGLRLRVGDVLELPWSELARAPDRSEAGGILLVGNLPYNVSKPIALRIVDGHDRIARAVLMFQREVALRILASPGTKDYGPLTVLVRLHFDVERVFDLPPAAFRPRPKVHSTVTRWRPRADAPEPERAVRLRLCLRDCFAARRRTLRNNARRALGLDERSADALFARVGVDPEARAETVDPGTFLRLADVWPASRR